MARKETIQVISNTSLHYSTQLTIGTALDPKYPDPAPHGGFNGSLECGVFSPPYVLSVSYGGWEADVPMAYQARQCNEFMKLGLQGVSQIPA